jgi:outer membrane lipoprotein-sorting protein
VWLLAILSLAACAAPPRRPAPPLSSEVRGVIEELETRWRHFEDLQGIVEFTVERRDGTQRFLGPLLLRAPAALRFEALSPLGQPLLVVAMDGETFTLYSLVEDRAMTGRATERTIARWLDIPLPPAALVALFAGYVLPLPEIEAGTLLRGPDEWRLELQDGDGAVQRIWLDQREGRARRVEWERPGLHLHASLGPDDTVTLVVPERQISLRLRYQTRATSVGLSLARFRVELPDGAWVTRVP